MGCLKLINFTIKKMGLIIKTTEKKQINIKDLNGQVTEVASVYARLEFASRIDGLGYDCEIVL